MTELKRRAMTVFVWVVTVIETLLMCLAGAGKFAGDHWPKLFEGWGYPLWFMYAIGTAEILGALLLLAPRLASWAAGGLAIIMMGAIITQIRQPAPGGWTAAAVHLALVIVIGVARWPVRLRPGSVRA